MNTLSVQKEAYMVINKRLRYIIPGRGKNPLEGGRDTGGIAALWGWVSKAHLNIDKNHVGGVKRAKVGGHLRV